MQNPSKLTYKEIDIESEGNEHWFEKYKFDIPVVYLDEEQIFKHTISERELNNILKQRDII